MSEWRISSMYLGGKKVYQVYRIKDMRVVDHSGNREYAGGLLHDEAEAISTERHTKPSACVPSKIFA